MQRKQKRFLARIWDFVRQEIRWLTPGLGVKRWVVLILIGTTLIGVGFAILLLDFYRNAPESWWLPLVSFLSLRFLTRPLRAIIFGGLGVFMILLGTWGLNRALLRPFLRPGRQVLEAVSTYRKRERGPRVVVIGGGTGQSTLLRGIKAHTMNLTAIVTMADDGGSSGILRRERGILPPGDIRNCLVALSSDEELLTQIFQYRFSTGAGLEGHSLGNLFITALANITGSFEEGVAESGRVLAVQGRVLPATLHDVKLVADIDIAEKSTEVRVKGESAIPKAKGRIRRVWLEPGNPLAYPPTLQAILNADLIIIGPGSLYTSLLPSLLVPDLVEAIRSSRGLKFYICNVATQPGETDGYTSGDHVRVLEKHLGNGLIDVVVCNNLYEGKLVAGIDWVRPEPDFDQHYAAYFANLVDDHFAWRHHSLKIAQVVMDLYYEKTGPLVNNGKEEG
jgi:uncharacterized cofD-like protein